MDLLCSLHHSLSLTLSRRDHLFSFSLSVEPGTFEPTEITVLLGQNGNHLHFNVLGLAFAIRNPGSDLSAKLTQPNSDPKHCPNN